MDEGFWILISRLKAGGVTQHPITAVRKGGELMSQIKWLNGWHRQFEVFLQEVFSFANNGIGVDECIAKGLGSMDNWTVSGVLM